MKKAVIYSALMMSAPALVGADLYFTNGSIINNTNALLSLSGPTNLVASIERLNPQSDTWESQGTVTLVNGTANFTNNLYTNIYGFYRAKGTNGTIFSTNAFGAFVGSLAPNYTLIGNIFGAQSITNILPAPIDGTQVLRWNSASQTYTTYTFDLDLGGWYPSIPSVDTVEGFWVRNPSTNAMRYVVSGLFTTNQVSKTIVTNLNLIVSPQYHITDYATWRVDTLDTNRLGGLSNIPVQTSGYNPQSIVYQQISTTPTYTTNLLTSANLWQRNGTNLSIHLEITEGFWLDKKGTNSATWTFQRAIW